MDDEKFESQVNYNVGSCPPQFNFETDFNVFVYKKYVQSISSLN